MDAVATAGNPGICPSRVVSYRSDRKGTVLNYKVLEKAIRCVRSSDGSIDENWKEEIEMDFEQRGRE